MCLAIPGKIVNVEGQDPIYRTGKVNFGGVIKDVSMAYVPDAQVGQYALVHAGVAISLIDEDEAKEIFGYLKEMREAGDLVGEDQ